MAGRQGRRWLARAWGLALLLLLFLAPAGADALEWRLPGRGAAPLARPTAATSRRQLQEVSPPAWVRKARLALEDRDPTVRILAPADGALLPDGPWTLRLQVADWPLVDAGPLGLGPHLVVQLDEEPPRPAVDTEVVMPPLSPGSHRLTVYAAKPWGEAHKSPLARQQIRLHRLAPNPATLPAPGTPQLIPVSPSGPAGSPPLLVDWLLIDTPLQGLRSDTSGWRLRLTVNGESVLVDQQTPLWLQGWTPGANALLFELLDGRGDPLNAPYNSLLREVVVSAGGATPSASRTLTDLELAVLLGDQPVSVLAPPAPDQTVATDPAPDLTATSDLTAAPEGTTASEPAVSPAVSPVVSPIASPDAAPEAASAAVPPAPSPEDAVPSPEPTTTSAEDLDAVPTDLPATEAVPTDLTEDATPDDSAAAAPEANPAAEDVPLPSDAPAPSGDTASNDQPATLATTDDPPTAPDAIPTAPPPALAAPTAASPATDTPVSPPPATPSAREEVNADGTLRRAPRPSVRQWLRERLG